MATKKMKFAVTFSASMTLISFVYKAFLGIYTMSLVLIIASISTLLVLIAKIMFIQTATKTRAQKKKAYLVITIVTFIYVLIFIAFSVLKVFGIDTSNDKTYEGIYGAIFIAFLLIMFILSLAKLSDALDKADLIVIGLKEITFVSALTDLVIIEEFVSRIILNYRYIELMEKINNYFVLGVSIVMIIMPIVMFIRYALYKPELYRD